MTKLYLNEIVTLKDDQIVVSPTATYSGENSDEVYREAEIAYHSKCAYNLQQKSTQKDFLVQVITETGVIIPEMKRFYRFPEEQPEPEPSNETESNTEG